MTLTRPHPPILIGGSGERKTLRLVARYAQACNLFNGPDLEHKLGVLHEHCEREGRPYEDIEKTVVYRFDVGQDGERAQEIIDDLGRLAQLGIQVAHGSASRVWDPKTLEVLGGQVLPAVADL